MGQYELYKQHVSKLLWLFFCKRNNELILDLQQLPQTVLQ